MYSAIAPAIRRMDWILGASVLLLLLVGLISLASLSVGSAFPYFTRQLIWTGIGVIGFFAAMLFDYRILRNYVGILVFLYLVLIGLLSYLLVSGQVVRGVQSWLHVGPFSIEPAEFIKIILILILAKYFSRRHVEIYRLRHLIISGLYIGIPAVFVLLQPDLGEATIIGSIWLGVVLFSGIKPKHLLIFFLLFAALAIVAWFFVLHPYQQARIVSFINPWNDPRGSGYNAIQSMIAVGSGGFLGKGIGYGSQSHLNFLPESETDFIFAAYSEEWGLVGALFLMAIYAVMFWRLMRIGIRSSDNFARLTVLGIATVFFVHLVIHVGMNVGIFPITGITLPFVSYGGSSLLTAMILAGIAEGIAIRSLKSGAMGHGGILS